MAGMLQSYQSAQSRQVLMIMLDNFKDAYISF